MQIIKTSIKRGVTFLMIYLIAVGFGLFSLIRLRVDLWPALDFPVIAIITQYTGVGPYDIENIVTRPIENTVASVKNVKTLNSFSRQGLSLIMLEFEWGSDMNQAEIDVRNYMDWVRDALPVDVTSPLVFAFDPSMQPIAFWTIGSKVHGLAELRRISEYDLAPRIERIPGVASANTMGGLKREINIQVDPVRLRAHHVSIQQVEAALRMNNLQLPSGWLDNDMQEFSIQTQGEYQTIEEIENTAVAQLQGTVVRMKDVADVVDGFADSRHMTWTNNKPAVVLVIQKQSDANTVGTTKRMYSQLPRILEELPRDVEIETIWDQAEFINRSMTNLGTTAIQAIALAFLVLLVFLRNFRSSVIVAVSIPISMIVTFAVMDQAGLTLNMISMAGLALAVGLLVDNSIVVLESIYRRREMGESRREAADTGAHEVAMAITASTLTTISVFVPVLFVPGLAGMLFRDMVVTICFSLGVSLLVALTLVPLMASRFLEIEKATKSSGFFNRLGMKIGNGIDAMRNKYSGMLGWALAHRKTVVAVTAGLLVIAIGMLALSGGEFLPQSDEGYIQIAVDRSPGTSLAAMTQSMEAIHEIIEREVPEGEMTYASFGQGEGVFAAFSARGSNQGEIMIRLPRRAARKRGMEEIQDTLREKFKHLADVEIRFEDRGAEAFFGGGGIEIKLFGHDLDIGEALARDIVKRISSVKEIVDTKISIEEAVPELRIQLDRQRIASLGLSTAQIGQVVSTSMLGSVATRFRERGDEFDVRVRLKEAARSNKRDLENILIMTPAGRQIPLRAIASVDYVTAPAEIIREDQERKVTITCTVQGNDLLGATRKLREALKDVNLPGDFRMEIGGAAANMMESFMYLGLAFLVAMLLVYGVMASQFESLFYPFIILFTIPLSIIGVAFGLFFTGTTLSVMSLIGIIMLVGIIVNNGIVLVDYINQLRDQGHEMFEAIRLAGEARMRPVLMTALTTILAMFPLSLGLGESGENWAPMARSVIGGLLIGTLLTLVVVPVIYAAFGLKSKKMHEKREAKRRLKEQSA